MPVDQTDDFVVAGGGLKKNDGGGTLETGRRGDSMS